MKSKGKPVGTEVVKLDVPVKLYKQLRNRAKESGVEIPTILLQAVREFLGE